MANDITITNLVRAVAEAKCQTCDGEPHGYRPLLDCSDCDMTGLRWPTLSRVPEWRCSGGTTICKNSAPNGYCLGHQGDRVPDVDLEKVLECEAVDWVRFEVFGDAIECHLKIVDVEYEKDVKAYGQSYLEAACAALLET